MNLTESPMTSPMRLQSERDAFAQTMLAELRYVLPTVAFTYDAADYRIASDQQPNGQPPLQLFLAPSFARYYAARPPLRPKIVTGIVQGALAGFSAQTMETMPLARAQSLLRPNVRERIHREMLRLNAQDGDALLPAFRLLNEHLTLEVTIDFPSALRSVNQRDLDTWGISFEEALDFATDNLLRTGTKKFTSPTPGLFVSDWKDDWDCCRLHLQEVVAGLPVKGRPIVMIPQRSCLIVTGDEDADGLLEMARIAEKVMNGPDAMCGMAFVFNAEDDSGKIHLVPWLPEASHPSYVPLQRLSVWTLAGYYARQKAALDAVMASKGIYVSSALLPPGQSDSGPLVSVSSWSGRVDTLLPETDFVVLLGDPKNAVAKDKVSQENVTAYRWSEVQAHLPHPMERCKGCYPSRWLVRGDGPRNEGYKGRNGGILWCEKEKNKTPLT